MNKSQPLPSLHAVRTFEVAARHGSFTEAAKELHVTQGAVSRQIQELERTLSCKLFIRSGPKLSLSEEGRVFAIKIRQSIVAIQEAVNDICAQPSSNQFTISMLPSVATKWLAPRLCRFIEQHPDIDLRVTASRHLVDFEDESVDSAIRYGTGYWTGLSSKCLASEYVTPVCSVEYAKNLRLLSESDILNATLLHSDIEEDWAAWFKVAGLSKHSIPRGPQLTDDSALLQAAFDGQGIALGRSLLIKDDINAGRLIAPFPARLSTSYSYWFVAPEQSIKNKNYEKVRQWIIYEMSDQKA